MPARGGGTRLHFNTGRLWCSPFDRLRTSGELKRAHKLTQDSALRTCFVLEAGSLGEEAEHAGRGAAGLVEAVLPFGDGGLAGAELVGERGLGEFQVAAEGFDSAGVPCEAASGHGAILYGSV